MFTGHTLATILTDANTVGTEIAFIIGVVLAFWGAGRLLRLFRRAGVRS